MSAQAVEQLDILEALEQRELAMASVMRNADEAYSQRFFRAIEVLAASGATFTSDQVRDLAGDPPASVHFNVAGALINAAAKTGLIRAVGYSRSARVVGHSNVIRTWVGKQS